MISFLLWCKDTYIIYLSTFLCLSFNLSLWQRKICGSENINREKIRAYCSARDCWSRRTALDVFARKYPAEWLSERRVPFSDSRRSSRRMTSQTVTESKRFFNVLLPRPFCATSEAICDSSRLGARENRTVAFGNAPSLIRNYPIDLTASDKEKWRSRFSCRISKRRFTDFSKMTLLGCRRDETTKTADYSIPRNY